MARMIASAGDIDGTGGREAVGLAERSAQVVPDQGGSQGCGRRRVRQTIVMTQIPKDIGAMPALAAAAADGAQVL